MTKAFSNSLSLSAGLLGTLLAVFPASATTITSGQANFGGSVTVNNSGIHFGGTIVALSPDDGGYTGLTGGTILDLLGPPTTGAVNVPKFVTFNTAGGPVFFDLTNIASGLGTAGACSSNTIGNVCTPTGSPFTLIQRTSGQVEIDFSVMGVAYTGTPTTGSDPTTGLFTTQNLIPGTITAILAQVGTANGIQNSYSATFSSVAPTSGVPEPGTYVLLGIGLISVASLRRRTRKV